MNENLVRLKELVEKKARQYGIFTLAAGEKVNHYFDLKKVLFDPEGAHLIGKSIFDFLENNKIVAIGGYGLGASLIVANVILIGYQEGKPILGFTVREGAKDHGTQKQIEGYLGWGLAIVDDVISTGKAIFKAISAVEARGYKVTIVIAALDRQLGGSEKLRQKGYNFQALLKADYLGGVHIY